MKPPWIVPAEVESHLLQGRTAVGLPLLGLGETQSGQVVDRRPRQLAGDQRSQDLEAAAPLEHLLRQHLALDLAPQRVVRRCPGRLLSIDRRRPPAGRAVGSTGGKTVQRVVPCAISSSSSSNRKASEIPSERPRWISWPEPVTAAPARGTTGRRNDIESSAVVIPCPGPDVRVDDRAERGVADHCEHAAGDQPRGVREPRATPASRRWSGRASPRSSRARSDSPSASTGSGRAARRPSARSPGSARNERSGSRPWRAPARSC